jgi:hypothetical protein
MVISCCGPRIKTDCSKYFQPVLTDMGVCYAINPIKYNDSVRATSFTEIFRKVFEPEKKNISRVQMGPTGYEYRLSIVLDSQNSKVHHGKYPGSFRVSINQRSDYTKVLDSAVTAFPGYHTYIQTNLKPVQSTEAVKKLSIEQRKCKLLNEAPDDSIFK